MSPAPRPAPPAAFRKHLIGSAIVEMIGNDTAGRWLDEW